MKISVRVKPGSKQTKVESTGVNNFTVWVREKPKEGEANTAVRDALAGYFGTTKSAVVLLKGRASKQKIFEVLK